MYGPSPVRKVSISKAIPVAFMYPAFSRERQLLQAMMEIRAFSPYHSSGLLGPEPLAGLENAGPTGSPSSDNLRNPGQVFSAGRAD